MPEAQDEETDEAPVARLGWIERVEIETPAWLLVISFIAVGIGELTDGPIAKWGVSAGALKSGRWQTLFSHAFAHAGGWHLFMNSAGLLALAPAVIAVLGRWPMSWLRFTLFYCLAAVAALATYLALHPNGNTPMLGASGAIFGLLGAVARIDHRYVRLVPLNSPQVWRVARDALRENIVLFAILFGIAWLTQSSGGLAWEAHIGGFLFGLLAIKWFWSPDADFVDRLLATAPAAKK